MCSPALLLLPDGRRTICTFRNSLDVLWGAPASVLGCPGSEGTVAAMLSVLELLVLGTAPVLATVPQISPAGDTRGDRALGLPHDRFQEPEPASGGCRSCCSTNSCHGHPEPQHPLPVHPAAGHGQ